MITISGDRNNTDMDTPHTGQLEKDARAMGIELDNAQIEKLLTYYKLLIEWNQVMNLTAITEYDDVVKKHFVDSLSLVKVFDVKKCTSVIDVGTGAGFPGLVLKIVFPHLQVTLLDSLNKRIQFLNAVIDQLDLNGVKAIHGRAEEIARQDGFRESFDLCVSRAVANLSTLSEYCLPFVRQGGYFISYKSEKAGEELQEAETAIKVLGGCVDKKAEFVLPDSKINRTLIVIKKAKLTPKKFPRRAGLPGKEPIGSL